MDWYDVGEILPGVLRVNDGDQDTSYILRGEVLTGVIDTGLGVGDLASVVRAANPAPPLVINTHCHPDHWQGNYQFSDTSMSAAEWAWVQSWPAEELDPSGPSALDYLTLKRPLPAGFDRAAYNSNRIVPPTRTWQEGDVIDLGGFRLEVVAIPAHTPGGIALLERRRRLLFTGDTVLRARIWLHLEESSAPEEVGRTYARLSDMAEAVDWVLPAHGVAMFPGEFLRELNRSLQRALRGEIVPTREHTFAGDGWFYDLDGYGAILRDNPAAR